MSIDATVSAVIATIRAHQLPLCEESALHRVLADLLADAGLKVSCEHVLGPSERLDLMVEGGLAIECKLRGGRRNIYRQLQRYARHDEVQALLLVTNTAMGLPPEIDGKPVFYCGLGEAWL